MTEKVIAKHQLVWKIKNFTGKPKGIPNEDHKVDNFVISIGENQKFDCFAGFILSKDTRCFFGFSINAATYNLKFKINLSAITYNDKNLLNDKRLETERVLETYWEVLGKFEEIATTPRTLTLTINFQFYRLEPPTESHPSDPNAELNARFFNSKDFSDITIMCSDEREIPAHGCILAGRSSVFEKMLLTEMTEKKTNRIVIEDIDGETMLEMLRYIYTQKVQNLETHASQLMYAAEKYDLPRLKSMCASQLVKQLSEENVFDTLLLARKLDEPKVLNECMEYINWNFSKLEQSTEWKKLDHDLMLTMMKFIKSNSIDTTTLVPSF